VLGFSFLRPLCLCEWWILSVTERREIWRFLSGPGVNIMDLGLKEEPSEESRKCSLRRLRS
jgi:hypothetical protein